MKGKLQLLFTFLFYLIYNLDEVATFVSSVPTEWKLQLLDVQAPTCIGNFYSLPLLLPCTLKSFYVTKNLQSNFLSSLSKIKHSNPLCFSYHNSFLTRPLRFINLCVGVNIYHLFTTLNCEPEEVDLEEPTLYV
jgi:hypothetical protein